MGAKIQNEKREEIIQKVGGMLASAGAHANSACMVRSCESHRDGVIALMLH